MLALACSAFAILAMLNSATLVAAVRIAGNHRVNAASSASLSETASLAIIGLIFV